MSEGTAKKPPRFGGQRIRSFAPKSRGGCLTCKRRRVKCDEGKPTCQRCLQGKRHCEGYEDPPKPWTFDATSRTRPSDDGTSSQHHLGREPLVANSSFDNEPFIEIVELSNSPVECGGCGGAHLDASCPTSVTPTLLRPSGSPYRQKSEQYLFKFFVEVAASTVSRSDISTYYWQGLFPQVAHGTSSVRDCLLAVSAAFHAASGPIFSVNPVRPTSSAASYLAYETRAMRALSRGNPTPAEVLNTSMAFWITSMVLGDWKVSLQHLYHCLKILRGLSDRSMFDVGGLRYQTALATIGLLYFRTTRGVCKIHGPGDFLDCDPECYHPEERNFPERVVDSLHHLKAALPTFEMCLELLHARIEPHSRHADIDTTLKREIREIKFLINTWSDQERMKISDEEVAAASAVVPYTASAFEPILADLIRYIVNDKHTTGIIWQELELRTRVAIPHIVASTSRGAAPVIEDSVVLMYYSGYTEGTLRARPTFSNKHVSELLGPYDWADKLPT